MPVLFLAALLVDPDFFDVVLLPALFFPLDFLVVDFLAAFFPLFGEGGMSAPARRASLKPIAIACFGFFTFLPLRPDFSSPCFISCMVSPIFFLTMRFDFGSEPDELFRAFLVAIGGDSPFKHNWALWL